MEDKHEIGDSDLDFSLCTWQWILVAYPSIVFCQPFFRKIHGNPTANSEWIGWFAASVSTFVYFKLSEPHPITTQTS